ncbi:penicillin-binding protein 2 [Methyloversatilis sp.]|uniref:peptidoglycan D,D-transpeptidase FtsI family protein n=1 Tax=Methyloversatilis sp. TaxID=2569862 RepID=UPI0027323B67|nr:penicillin-binding protein 2 [Methyloversatilis sp.]MDP2869394.1 penicillin-binding protein 2 [Methyloversatilis sp.]MDP3455959.1 penicillin-binding protein 2 [Methyloversatilis sp.]MDP3580050.1 penicillin-binding protein 2 [Methyloversatilis sp.]
MKFAHNPLLAELLPAWRARAMLIIMMVLFGGLFVRAFWLQAIDNEFYQRKGEERFSKVLPTPASRGRVLDRNEQVLAMSTQVSAIVAEARPSRTEAKARANPRDIGAEKLSPAQIRQLADLLDMDHREVARKIPEQRGRGYLKRQVAPDVAERILALKLPGIRAEPEYRRYYPHGEVSAHVVGFTGMDDNGLEGIELAMNRPLTGQEGSRRVITDARRNVVEDVETLKPPRDGGDVRLSIDTRLQFLAHSRLKQAVAEHKARAGSAVVLDSRTGEVLALANWPTYNPNNRAQLSGPPLRNRAFTDTYEPGSTIKPFVAAMALDAGRYSFDTPIDCTGKLHFGRYAIGDAHPHGVLSVAEVIQKSSNVGVAKIAAQFTPEEMWRVYDQLGFGSPLKLGFPGEAAGRLRNPAGWKPVEQATMSYGHGMSVTLMQMARAYMVLARDGDLIPLSLTRVDTPPINGLQVFSAQTAREVRRMLELAAGPGGTAPKAQIPGYRVAGKTGTAHKLEGGTYANKYIASFVGFAPVSDPRYIVAVMIDEPSNGVYYGGQVAAPVFSDIMNATLRATGVAPDAAMPPLQMARVSVPVKGVQ